MKQYDSIKYYGDYWGNPIIAFDKLDGSNIRAEYSRKQGFHKFGTRREMIDHSSPFSIAIDLFLTKYEKGLTDIFKSKEYRDIERFTCFAELLGTKSAFGQHDFENDTFDITLFDVDQYKKGFIPPKTFVKTFEHLGIPRVIYEGNLNKEFVERVKMNEFGLTEGVICKGELENKRHARNGLFYCKIKTNDWFERLRAKSPDMYDNELKQVNNEQTK